MVQKLHKSLRNLLDRIQLILELQAGGKTSGVQFGLFEIFCSRVVDIRRRGKRIDSRCAFRAHNLTVETKFLNSSQIFDRVTREERRNCDGIYRGDILSIFSSLQSKTQLWRVVF